MKSSRHLIKTKAVLVRSAALRVYTTSQMLAKLKRMPTVISFVTDADGSTGAVPVTATQTRTSFPDIHVVYAPTVALAGGLLLNPAELRGAEDKQEILSFTDMLGGSLNSYKRFIMPYPEETWSGS